MKRFTLLAVLSMTAVLSAVPVQSDSFQKDSRNWDTRKYWGGEVSRENSLLVVKTTDFKNSGRYWGRALGTPVSKKVALADKHFKLTVTVKGKGDFECGFLFSLPRGNGKFAYRYMRSEPVKLTGEFQQISFTVDLTGVAPRDMTPFVEVKGQGNVAYLQSSAVEETADGGDIVAEPLYTADFTKGRSRSWATRKYWGGEVKMEKNLLTVKSTYFSKRGDFWGRAMGTALSSDIKLADKCFKIEVIARGKGGIAPGFLLSTKKDNGKWSYKYVQLKPAVQLTGEFQKISYTTDLTGAAPTTITPFFDVLGEGNFANIRQVSVWQTASGGVKAVDYKPAPGKKAASAKKAVSKPQTADCTAILLSSENFKKNLRSWATRKYWGGEVSKSGNDLLLKATNYKNRGKFWGRVMGTPPRRLDCTGKRLTITVNAKGQGELFPGFLITSKDEKGKSEYKYVTVDQAYALTDVYKRYSFTIDLFDQVPFSVTPFVDVRGENSFASIKEIRIERNVDSGAVMELVTPFTPVPLGSAVPAREFKFSKPDVTVQTFQIPDNAGAKAIIQPEISAENGIVKVPVQGAVNGLVKIIASAGGAAAEGFVLGMDKAVYDRLDALAGKINAEKTMSILYIADSLSDFDRGFNAIDHLEFFLNKYNPGKFKIYNYAVAGDFIQRVEDRLTGKRPYDKRYTGIFDRQYDLIIIALGNNDTRASSSTNYEKPLVPVAEIKPAYEKVIGIVRKNSPAPVWLISASKSDSELFVKKSDAATARGRTGIRFGIEQHAKNFNTQLQSVAASGKNIRYIDIFNPMKSAFDPDNYRKGDGVHLSIRGHQLFAELLLKAFIR